MPIVYITKEELYPYFIFDTKKPFLPTDTPSDVDAATLKRWQEIDRLFNQMQNEMQTLYGDSK